MRCTARSSSVVAAVAAVAARSRGRRRRSPPQAQVLTVWRLCRERETFGETSPDSPKALQGTAPFATLVGAATQGARESESEGPQRRSSLKRTGALQALTQAHAHTGCRREKDRRRAPLVTLPAPLTAFISAHLASSSALVPLPHHVRSTWQRRPPAVTRAATRGRGRRCPHLDAVAGHRPALDGRSGADRDTHHSAHQRRAARKRLAQLDRGTPQPL